VHPTNEVKTVKGLPLVSRANVAKALLERRDRRTIGGGCFTSTVCALTTALGEGAYDVPRHVGGFD